MDDTTWQDMIDVNLTGVWHAAKAAIPHLRAAGGGSIILTSSTAGLKAIPNTGHYNSAKHGVVGLMRTLAQRAGPGHDPGQQRAPHRGQHRHDPELRHLRAVRARICRRRSGPRTRWRPRFGGLNLLPIPWVEPVDISNAVLWLASDESRYVTGVTLPIDAGLLIK